MRREGTRHKHKGRRGDVIFKFSCRASQLEVSLFTLAHKLQSPSQGWLSSVPHGVSLGKYTAVLVQTWRLGVFCHSKSLVVAEARGHRIFAKLVHRLPDTQQAFLGSIFPSTCGTLQETCFFGSRLVIKGTWRASMVRAIAVSEANKAQALCNKLANDTAA